MLLMFKMYIIQLLYNCKNILHRRHWARTKTKHKANHLEFNSSSASSWTPYSRCSFNF